MTTQTFDFPVPTISGPVSSYLERLNSPQREAVEATEGPLLVLAGAGTGKTSVLTTRIAHILATQRAWPSQILAVTFTNKAAQEMRDRVSRLIGQPVDGLWIGTFHSVAARMLRRNSEVVGLTPHFTILDRDDQLRIVKQILQDNGVASEVSPPRYVLTAIQRFKDRGLPPHRVTDADVEKISETRIREFYGQYQDRLLSLNAVDFGDLLLHCLTIFTSNSDILGAYQERFRYILVDEYQDTNVAQYLWLRLLAIGRENLCCVGDDDQAIYSWRGAELGNILRFDKDFANARIIRLEENYRSTGAILAAASRMVANNHGRLGKTLWTGRRDGSPVEIHKLDSGEAESRFVVSRIEDLQRQGGSLDEIAILVRAGFQMRELEERLTATGVPYRIVGGLRFYESREIRDAIAYFRCVVHPDDSLAFERIMNLPRRGLGPATLQTLFRFADAESVSLGEAARQLCETDELRPQARSSLRRFLQQLQGWRDQLQFEHHVDIAKSIIEESGYLAMWQESREPDAPGRIENLGELLSAIAQFESLSGFLEHVSLVFDRDEGASGEAVRMMTLHAAKGLEFDNVILPGWEENIFPHKRALEDAASVALEEERRLAYVGLTRARFRVWISHVYWRRVRGQRVANRRSRFVDEMCGEHVTFCNHSYEDDRYGRNNGGVGNAVGTGRGPGFRRMKNASPAFGDRSPGGANAARITENMRIFHQKFGYGKVTRVDGEKLGVEFEKAGYKTIMKTFVKPA